MNEKIYTYTFSTSSGGGIITSNFKIEVGNNFEYDGIVYLVVNKYDDDNFIVNRL
jgi:hypothetical protein